MLQEGAFRSYDDGRRRSTCRECEAIKARKRRASKKLSAADVPPEASDVITAAELGGMTLKAQGPKMKSHGKQTTILRPADGERWLIPGDLHFGIQDDVSIGLMMQCATDWGIDRCILQGDTLDCYGISRHDHRADKIRGTCFSLEDEGREAYYFLQWIAKTKLPSYIMPGNHEDRIWALEDKNLGLHGSLTLRGLFGIPGSVQVLPQYSRIVAGSLTIEHGHKLPGSLGAYGSAKVLRDHPDQCTLNTPKTNEPWGKA
jgi:hypothetical protein